MGWTRASALRRAAGRPSRARARHAHERSPSPSASAPRGAAHGAQRGCPVMRYSGTATRQIPTEHGRRSPGSVFSICAFISTADESTADAQPSSSTLDPAPLVRGALVQGSSPLRCAEGKSISLGRRLLRPLGPPAGRGFFAHKRLCDAGSLSPDGGASSSSAASRAARSAMQCTQYFSGSQSMSSRPSLRTHIRSHSPILLRLGRSPEGGGSSPRDLRRFGMGLLDFWRRPLCRQ